MKPKPWSFLLVALAGWMQRTQQDVIDYLQEENRVLREHFGESGPEAPPMARRGSPELQASVAERLLGLVVRLKAVAQESRA